MLQEMATVIFPKVQWQATNVRPSSQSYSCSLTIYKRKDDD